MRPPGKIRPQRQSALLSRYNDRRMEPQESESRFDRQWRAIDEIALEFTKLCLLQADATQDLNVRSIRLTQPIGLPDWITASLDEFEYDFIGAVMPVVTTWCRRNCILFSIDFSQTDGFTCTFQPDYRPNLKVEPIEVGNSWDLCHLLLAGCVAVAKKLDRVFPA